MSYEYDAFFSYKRDRETDAWHETVKDKLLVWVGQELSRNIRVFFDTEDIRTGMRWRRKVGDALLSSKCLICVWSPLYFKSAWCISEWRSFLERGKIVDRELILPASFFDGETFPEEARDTQFVDFSEFASTMPRFWDTELAVKFEQHYLKPFAKELARIIRAAPPFKQDFPIVEANARDIREDDVIDRISHV